jgi:hypothetical protein
MATAAQIAANRANSQKSTGPRTPEGKAASRFNALKHGLDAASILLPGEDPDAYDRMVADYAAPINTPKTPASTCSWPCTLPTNSTTTRRIGFGRRPTLTQRPYPKCALHPMPWPPAPDPWPLIP